MKLNDGIKDVLFIGTIALITVPILIISASAAYLLGKLALGLSIFLFS